MFFYKSGIFFLKYCDLLEQTSKLLQKYKIITKITKHSVCAYLQSYVTPSYSLNWSAKMKTI